VHDAPLLAAWLSYRDRVDAPFTIPGHKGVAGRLSPALGAVLTGDVPLYGGLDTVKLTGHVLADAETRAAALWGVDWCRFSVGGSTHANQALMLAIGAPGDKVLVARSAHRSTLLGLVLAGLTPVWLPVAVDERFGVPVGVTTRALEGAIAEHPTAKAVLLVEPSYLGTFSDRAALATTAHDAGLAVVVDQAWGAHLGFHPRLPAHALATGADAIAVSAHKTLPAYSQASLALARTGRLDRHRLERAFDASHTTSPAGSILASIDGARALLAARGEELLGDLLVRVDRARDTLRDVDGLVVFSADDPTKLVLLLAGTGASGNDIERDLIAAGLPVEMADRDTLVPILTMADTDESVDRLVAAVAAAVERRRGPARAIRTAVQWGPPPPAAITPREAYFRSHSTVDAATAVGRISAELVAPYPPGVPVLVPGEIVTSEALAALREAQATGTRIAYAADPTLATLQVVA
jgi:lysine decarboxylase